MSRIFFPATHASCLREAATAGTTERLSGAVAPLPNWPDPAREPTCEGEIDISSLWMSVC